MRKSLLAFLVLGATACGPGDVFDDVAELFRGENEVQGAGTYRITETGLQCVRAPCPYFRVSRLDADPSTGLMVSELEFPSNLSQEKRQQARDRVRTPDGLVAHGTPQGNEPEGTFVIDALVEP
jgi:hypothetical protein